ncbi:hypothetical protein A0256_12470 [Mucilaginibacter sp. PAMC 26640]|nr:hypothetical protein A0256_12470 [Mucilaginibacter sp. PAMC 26640]
MTEMALADKHGGLLVKTPTTAKCSIPQHLVILTKEGSIKRHALFSAAVGVFAAAVGVFTNSL